MVAGLVVWCVSAAALAVLVFRRVAWARIVLVVSASAAGALCLVGAAMGAFVLLLPLVASVCCIALLLRGDVRPGSTGGLPRQVGPRQAGSPSSITAGSLQKAQRTSCRPASES